MNITKCFKLAENASKNSDYKNGKNKIGSVIMYKNKVLGVGYNASKTNPLQAYYNKYREETDNNREFVSEEHLPCVHAEMMALLNTRNMSIDWKKTSIFVYRKNGNCRPCKACMKALKDRGIKDVYYYNSKGAIIYETFS